MSKRTRKIAKLSHVFRELGRESQMKTVDLERAIDGICLLPTELIDLALDRNALIVPDGENKTFVVQF